MSLNQARIVTTILTGLVLFAEVNIPDWNAKANPSQPKTATLLTTAPTMPELSQTNNIPQLNVALQHLKVAKSELENSDDKDLNSQSTALEETNKAIAEIEAVLKSDPKRSILQRRGFANAKSSKLGNCNT